MLLTVDDFEHHGWPGSGCTGAGVQSSPLILGGGRAWSAATAIWQSGRDRGPVADCAWDTRDIERTGGPAIKCRLEPIPACYETGRLRMAHGLRVQPPAALVAAITEAWGEPELIVCDRFRLGELKDCTNGTQVIPRV